MDCSQGIFRAPPAIMTDLYQLTMAQAYWKLHRADTEAVFHLFFRSAPFNGRYAIAAGLDHAIDFLRHFNFDQSDLDYLATLTGNDNNPLFHQDYLHYLSNLKFSCDLDAVPEGTVVFANEPLIRVRGPILQCQLLESMLLNLINFQTLIATKASRIAAAAAPDPVLEFGLRRAQGLDGALSASRAAYIGGCAATSNVLAGKIYDIPVKGTHAHSWIMSFDDESVAFEAYADAMPNNCVFLVDTYDTLTGVERAIDVGLRLRARGHEMVGIRLDSGDLAFLSIHARRLLDDAGFEKAAIVASNDLDEYLIRDLKQQGATIAVWGVGTKLATSHDQPALGGVYKLGALRQADGSWSPRVKLSENTVKTSIPGMLQVRRFEDTNDYVADMIFDELSGQNESRRIVDPNDPTRSKDIPANAAWHDLLVPVTRNGKFVYQNESLDVIRNRAQNELSQLHSGVRRLLNPHEYPVGLEPSLHTLRAQMIEKARQSSTKSRECEL